MGQEIRAAGSRGLGAGRKKSIAWESKLGAGVEEEGAKAENIIRIIRKEMI